VETFPLIVSIMSEKISITQELISIIGMDAAERLCLVFGGARLYIGIGNRSQQRLSAVVGDEAAEKLASHYRGINLHVPKMKYLESMRRNMEITADAASGMSQRELSMKYDLSERQIRHILHSALSENDSRNETD
jgi:hypothetical protein